MSRRPFYLAAAAICAVALISPGLGTSGAFAAPVPSPGATAGPAAANPALINPSANTTLTIEKHTGAPTSLPNNGTQQTVTSPALAGVTFSVAQVTGVDLTTNAGWAAAKTYYAADPFTAPANLGTAVTGTTDANGNVSFNSLPVGLYYVTETSAPAGYTKSAPFYVTLPTTNPTDTSSWLYDVYVYPKNVQDTATKTASDKGTQTGANATGTAANHVVDYTLATSITDGLTGPQMGLYVVNDNLDPRVDLTGVDVTLSDSSATLVAGTDYNIWAGPDAGPLTSYTSPATVTGGPTISIVFTAAGLAKLAAAGPTATVNTVLHTTLNASATGDGAIANTAQLIPNSSWWDQNKGPNNPYNPQTPGTTPPGTSTTTPGIPSNTSKSEYGDVSILKYDAKKGTTSPLSGAEFAVYQGTPGNSAVGTCDAANMTDANLLIPSSKITATDNTGATTISGLQVSSFYNNAVQTSWLTYCLVETKAPAGYNLNAQPIAFTVDAAGTSTLKQLQVADEPTNLGNQLPLTGGQGVAAMSLVGLVLVGGGVSYYAASSRKRREA